MQKDDRILCAESEEHRDEDAISNNSENAQLFSKNFIFSDIGTFQRYSSWATIDCIPIVCVGRDRSFQG